MRNKYIPLFILFFLLPGKHSILNAQEGWFSINRIADGNDMNSVYFVNDSVGFTVSNEGNLFMTTNKGEDWSYNKLSSSSLNDIMFIDYVGFIAGDGGKIFRSTDGVNWDELNSGTTNRLSAVYFIDIDTGYVFGDNSTILKTIDGGETWNKLNVQSGYTITDGAFPTPNFGMCVSMEGVLIRTQDYGKTWQYAGFPDGNSFSSIFFTDTSTAYVTGWGGDVGYMLKLIDRGNDFEVKWPETYMPRSSYFVDSLTAYVVSDGGYIAKTTDGGDSWIQQNSFTFKNLQNIYFQNDTLGYACGEDSTILRTTDGGLNWRYLGSSHTLGFYDIDFPDERHGYIVSSNGFILKTEDEGVNWEIYNRKIPGDYPEGFECIYFLNPDTGFIGAHGQILKTTNGGDDWEITDLRPQNITTSSSIKFYDNKIGMITADEYIIKTTDCGQNWFISQTPASTYPREVWFLDAESILLVLGSIYKSTDAGNSWTEKLDITKQAFISISFIDNKIGCAVGTSGTIYRTTDGGETWAQIPSNTLRDLNKIKFVSTSNGYIVGEEGVILYTIDAGLSWSTQESNTQENLSNFFFVNSTTGYIVGNSGVMLKTINGGIVGVEEDNPVIPTDFYLYQNYPNPFNPSTVISYQLPEYSHVTIKIYNSLGQEVRELVNGEQSPGRHKIIFNAGNLASGVYYYRIIADDISIVKKMTIIK